MKSTFKLVAIAVAALSLTVACKSKAPEVVEDTMPEEVMVIDTIDTIEEVAEEVVAPEEPVKKTVKKAEKTTQTKSTEIKNDAPKGNTLPSTTTSKKVSNGVEAKSEAPKSNTLPSNSTPSKKLK